MAWSGVAGPSDTDCRSTRNGRSALLGRPGPAARAARRLVGPESAAGEPPVTAWRAADAELGGLVVACELPAAALSAAASASILVPASSLAAAASAWAASPPPVEPCVAAVSESRSRPPEVSGASAVLSALLPEAAAPAPAWSGRDGGRDLRQQLVPPRLEEAARAAAEPGRGWPPHCRQARAAAAGARTRRRSCSAVRGSEPATCRPWRETMASATQLYTYEQKCTAAQRDRSLHCVVG